jgi:hypothetical protein
MGRFLQQQLFSTCLGGDISSALFPLFRVLLKINLQTSWSSEAIALFFGALGLTIVRNNAFRETRETVIENSELNKA